MTKRKWEDYMQGFKITSKPLAKLDRQRFLLNADVEILSEQGEESNPSHVTIERIQNRIAEIRKGLAPLRPRRNFHDIMRQDIISNVDAIDHYLKFRFLWDADVPADDRTSIDELVDVIYERDVSAFLEKRVRNMDHKAQDQIYRLSRVVDSYSFPATHQEVQQQVEKYLNEVPKILRRFLVGTNLDNVIDEIEIEVNLSDGDGAQYHGELFLIQLDRAGIRYYQTKNGSKKVQHVTFLLDAIHETGHLVNDRYSPFVPKGVQCHPMSFPNPAQYVTGEGLARWVEHLGLEWLQRNKKSLRLSDKELVVGELGLKTAIDSRVLPCIFTYLFLKDHDHEDVDVHGTMAEISGIPALFRDPEEIVECYNLEEFLYSLNTVIGVDHVTNLMKKVSAHVSNEYGPKYVQKHYGLLARGLFLGVFRPKTQERFIIEEYVPRVIKYIQNELE